MSSSKKMLIAIVSLIVAIVIVALAIVIVLVAGGQSGNTKINVKYVATDVAVTISATCYIGENSYPFNTNEDGVSGESKVSLSLDGKTTAILYQPQSSEGLNLSKTNQTAVFEYVFQNDTYENFSTETKEGIDINISLLVYPGYNVDESVDVSGQSEGVTVSFAVSDTQIADFSELTTTNTFDGAILNAGSSVGAKKYVYVVVSVSDLLYNATFKGSFEWELTRA